MRLIILLLYILFLSCAEKASKEKKCVLENTGLPVLSIDYTDGYYMGVAWEEVEDVGDIEKLKEKLRKKALADLSERLEVFIRTESYYRGLREDNEIRELFSRYFSAESALRLRNVSFKYGYEPEGCYLVVKAYVDKYEAERAIREIGIIRNLISEVQDIISGKDCDVESLKKLRRNLREISVYESIFPEVKRIRREISDFEDYCERECYVCAEEIKRSGCERIARLNLCFEYLKDMSSLFPLCYEYFLELKDTASKKRITCAVKNLRNGLHVDEVIHMLGKPEMILDGTFYGYPQALKYGDYWLIFEEFSLSCKVRRLKTKRVGITKVPLPCSFQK